MPFITQGKTNWKFILVVVALALVAAGGILVHQNQWSREKYVNISNVTTNCANEGERVRVDGQGFPAICCLNLKPMYGSDREDCALPDMPGDIGVCSNCGDGVCEPQNNENKCNCSQDCSGIETINWKTYKNEEFEFEFNYPNDWMKTGEPCDWRPFCLYVIAYNKLPDESEEGICLGGIDICYKKGFDSYKNAFSESRLPPNYSKDSLMKFINIDGKNAGQLISYDVHGGDYVIETLLFTDDVRIQLSLVLPVEPYKPLPDNLEKNQDREKDLNRGIFPDEETKEMVLIYNQMLKSFRFLP
ncbi:MAG: hypothetical protein UR98_C0002G0062 [Parcubacteria group bacterium GW2011_GWA1_36_12]|nr:MAG: hypothetical protein UR98_C0002G0062 [Parcubacteria group bacterium GW2011_GWA1_36_12]